MPCQFSLAAIKNATNNFNETNFLEAGGEGEVYKGHIQIDDLDTTVAIKLLKTKYHGRIDEEINLVSGLHHGNVLSLIGYCKEPNYKILVYEYMHNGSLAKKLYPTCSLNWMELLNICIGTAHGLDYLHRGTSPQHKIIHRDVKPGNILLDENWVAKISDFGLLKRGLSSNRQESNPISTDLKGTIGYLAPEYVYKKKVSTKTDIYAFGVVLLEVLCQKKRKWPLHDDSNTISSEVEEEIGIWARTNIATSLKHQISVNCLEKFIDVARTCLLNEPNQRPSMDLVVSGLQESMELQKAKSSFVLYFSSYNSASEKIETKFEDSLLVRVILKVLQLNVEEKNVSKYETYKVELSQIVDNDLCLPLIYTEEEPVIGFDMFIQLYREEKLISRLIRGSSISFRCESCGDAKTCHICLRESSLSFRCGSCEDAKTCHICVCSSRFAVCKVGDTLTMLSGEKGKQCCPNCKKDQLYPRTLMRTSKGHVYLKGTSLSWDDHSVKRGLEVGDGDTFPESIPLTCVQLMKSALIVTLVILWVGFYSWMLAIAKQVPMSTARIIDGSLPALKIQRYLLDTFYKALWFCIPLILKPVVTVFVFLAVNSYEALLFCCQLLKPLVPYIADVLIVGFCLFFLLKWRRNF